MKAISVVLFFMFSTSARASEFNPSLPAEKRCIISASERDIDFGVQSRGQLQESNGGRRLSPGKRNLMINVVCPFAQTMVIAIQGDRAANGNLRYGDRGDVILRLLDVNLDGQHVQIVDTSAQGDAAATNDMLLQPGQYVAATRNGQRLTGKTFSARIEIEPMVPEGDARVTQPHTTQSQLSLELIE
ncbi:fimbrial protein [Pantoea sp.]|uniref:fimbrial protein n=1 Tax=Pantoea sp. TaxID=69393 RepID=UPI0031E12498